MDAVVLVVDPQLRLTFVGGGGMSAAAWAEEGLVGRTLKEVVPPERNAVLEALYRAALGGETPMVELPSGVRWPDRSYRVKAAPLWEAGRIVAAVSIAEDFTVELRAVEQQRREEQKYRAVVASAGDGIVVFELPSTIILEANPAFCAIAGRTEQELVGRTARSFIAELDEGERQDDLARLLAGETVERRRTLTRPDGARSVVEACSTRLDDTRGVVVVRDISERIRLDDQLHESQRLETLGVLAGGIAHDFNNLLQVILGHTLLLQEGTGISGSSRRALGQIERASLRAADLTAQLLAYAGKGLVTIGPVNVNELLAEMQPLLATTFADGVASEYRLASQVPVVNADATQIRQTAMNLILNAAEACGAQGRVTISTGSREFDGAELRRYRNGQSLKPGRYVVISVEDTGSGMDEATLGQIFEPFYTTKHFGRGLGLAAVLGIIKTHQGAINVSSQPQTGTTVTVILPTF